jgi:hypothetical protein
MSGEIFQLDLAFTGEEVLKTEQPGTPSGGGSGGSGGSESGQTAGAGQETPTEQAFQTQSNVYEITVDITAGNVSLSLVKGDEAKFTYKGKEVSVKVKSLSDFAALFTVSGNDMVIGEKDSAPADINGDGFAELQITVGSVKDGKAEVILSLIEKPQQIVTGGSSATGMAFWNSSGLWISVYAIMIIAVAGSGIYLLRRRG